MFRELRTESYLLSDQQSQGPGQIQCDFEFCGGLTEAVAFTLPFSTMRGIPLQRLQHRPGERQQLSCARLSVKSKGETTRPDPQSGMLMHEPNTQ